MTMTTQLKNLSKITEQEFNEINYVTPCGLQAQIDGKLVSIFDITYELFSAGKELFIINGEGFIWADPTSQIGKKLKYTSNILRAFKHAHKASK
tara:strand:+ start:1019 stop:1300 length:282 start_codon:yes stop_codon:yes gene_type:complete